MKWPILVVLAAAQFLMVLDQAVMNVAISQLVADFDTTVTTIQTVIALYALVMAALMVTGAKLGDIWGRRRVFAIGLVIYASGSALTAASWSVPTLMLGWSVLEGIGAAMVLPALVALVAGNYAGSQRAIAYGVLGGVAGAGIAVGPILGGWATTELTWRVVFVGEVVVAMLILFGTRYLREPEREGSPPRLDWVGSVLAALGMATVVIGVLQASNWGWLRPLNSPVEPFGFSLTPFVIAAGLLILAGFRAWERHREKQGSDPLVHFRLFGDRQVPRRPFDAAGSELDPDGDLLHRAPLPPSRPGARRARDRRSNAPRFGRALHCRARRLSAFVALRAPPARARRAVVTFLSTLLLLGVIEPDLDDASFLLAMGVLGIGMGLIISQLGNVAQSSVTDSDRSEAGGLQNTAQQLGSSLGTALLGAVVITGLITAFTSNIASDPRVSAEAQQQVETAIAGGVSFISADEVRTAATDAGAEPEEVDALVEGYEDAQLNALKTAFLFAGFIVVASFWARAGSPPSVWWIRALDPTLSPRTRPDR